MNNKRKIRPTPPTPGTPATPSTPALASTPGTPGTPGTPEPSSAMPPRDAPVATATMSPAPSAGKQTKEHHTKSHHHAHQGHTSANEPNHMPTFEDFMNSIDLEKYRDANGVIQCPVPKDIRDKLKYEY